MKIEDDQDIEMMGASGAPAQKVKLSLDYTSKSHDDSLPKLTLPQRSLTSQIT